MQTNMSNLYAHMPMKAHAHKKQYTLEATLLQKSAHKNLQRHTPRIKKTSLFSCTKGKKIYTIWWHFPQKIESSHRKKENKNKTHVTSQNHLSGRDLPCMWNLTLQTIVHSFTRTQIIDRRSTIEGVHVPKIPTPNSFPFVLMKICLQARQFQ